MHPEPALNQRFIGRSSGQTQFWPFPATCGCCKKQWGTEITMKVRAAFLGIFLLTAASQHVHACEGIAIKVAGVATCLKPGDTFKDCPDCPQLTVIPSGIFVMGAPPNIKIVSADAVPRHQVEIAAPLAVGTFEITRGQYKAFVADSGFDDTKYWKNCTTLDIQGFGKAEGKTWKDTGFAQGDDHPVVCVSWEAATKYAAWLSKKIGATYRLPSESEWEYAARAGATGLFAFDPAKEIYCRHMNLADKAANREPVIKANYRRYNALHHDCDDGYAFTAPVGTYKANAFGLHDMHGNVWEWVQDCYNGSYSGAPNDGSARAGPSNCKRVTRGGGWFWHDAYQALPKRKMTQATADDRGFRIAREIASSTWW